LLTVSVYSKYFFITPILTNFVKELNNFFQRHKTKIVGAGREIIHG